MHTSIGKIIVYVGWTIFVGIILVLTIGIIKFDGNIQGYISFLNTRDWTSMSSISQTFRGDTQTSNALQIDTFVTGDLSAEILLQETGTGLTGLDAYDPSLELEMQAASSSGFGFVSPQDTSSQEQIKQPTDSKQQLLNLIKNRTLQTPTNP